MRYYLYSKALSPEAVLEQVCGKRKNRHPAITAIATFKKGVGIHFSLSEFADKYLDGGSRAIRWFTANREAKKELFRDYMSRNQERADWNNFGVIAADGDKFEPLDFIPYVEEVNNNFKKVPNDNATT